MENAAVLLHSPFSILHFYFNNLLKRPAPVSSLRSTSPQVVYAR